MRCTRGISEAEKEKGTNRGVTSTQAMSLRDRQEIQAGPQGPSDWVNTRRDNFSKKL